MCIETHFRWLTIIKPRPAKKTVGKHLELFNRAGARTGQCFQRPASARPASFLLRISRSWWKDGKEKWRHRHDRVIQTKRTSAGFAGHETSTSTTE